MKQPSRKKIAKKPKGTKGNARPTLVRAAAFEALSAENDTNIHQLIADLIVEVITLKDSISDPDQRAALNETRDRLRELSADILNQEIEASTADFNVATKALKDAAAAAKEAQKKIDKTVQVLQKTAQAIKLASALLALA
jgi:hypothetical protein